MADCGGNGPKQPASLAELRVRITLQSPKTSPDTNDLNEVDPRSADYWLQRGLRKCKVQNNPGRELVVADMAVSQSSFLVTLRYDTLTRLIDHTWRLVQRRSGLPDAIWQVESATNWNERNLWVLLRCTQQG